MASQISSQSHELSSPSSVHEKGGATVIVQSPSEDGGIDGVYTQTILRGDEQVNVTWTAAEERKVVLKVDMVLMPLFAVCPATQTRSVLHSYSFRGHVRMDGY